MIEAIMGLVGVILGVVLNEGVSQRREQCKERKQAEAVRTLLKLEIDYNIKSIENLKGTVEKYNQGFPEDIKPPLPSFSYRAWESQMSLLTIALDKGSIERVNEFYTSLDAVSAYHSRIITPEGNPSDVWSEYQSLISNIFEKGNPLKI
jgi:hypothetical protein